MYTTEKQTLIYISRHNREETPITTHGGNKTQDTLSSPDENQKLLSRRRNY